LPKVNPHIKEQIKFAVRNPVKWWKGVDLPEEKLRPWEGGIHTAEAIFNGFQRGFTDMRGRLYIGMADGLVPPMMNAAHDIIGITFDAVTDPPIGVHMDQRQYPVDFLRKIIRFEATANPLTLIFTLFNFGLSPMARVSTWVIVWMLHSVMGTANHVSREKLWAGITPHTEQRGQLQLWRSIGGTVGAVFTGLPNIFMGLRHVLGITDYHIMVIGAMIFLPITIFGRWLPSFAKQRVDFTQKVNAQGEEDTHAHRMTFRETFAIVKHNRWFIMWTVINFVRIFTPRTDHMNMYRFLVREIPGISIGGRPIGGELLFTLKDIIFGWPHFVAAPLAVHAVKFLRGPVNFIRVDSCVIMFTHLTSFLVGWRNPATGQASLPRLAYMWTMESFRGFFNQWRDVPHMMVNFEMFDYVEWKTGHRSEGLTAAVYGIINKLIRNNIGSIFGNAITQWTGFLGWEIPPEEQPQRFINSIWPLSHLGIVAGEIIALIGLLWFRYPHDPQQVERELIEKRALIAAQQQVREEHELDEYDTADRY